MYSKNDKNASPVLSIENYRSTAVKRLIHDLQEEEDWIGAKLNNCQEAYESYIQAYPTGRHVHAAKRYLMALETAKQRKPYVETADHSVQGFFTPHEGLVISVANMEVPTSRTLHASTKALWVLGGGIIAFTGIIWYFF